MPAVTVLMRVLCWLDFWRCWCFRWRGCRWRWFWVRVGGGPDRLGAVVGQCWVAFCVGLLLVRVSYVLVFWWVLGSLVLPMVPPLVSGVSAGEGVVASGLGVGGGAGVGVVVPGPGVGRGRSGVTGCGRSPLLAAGLVGPPLRPSGFWRPCSPPGGGGLLGSCCLGFVCVACVVRAAPALPCVVCVCGARVGGGCGGVCCVHARACVRCVGGAFGCLSSPLWAWFGGPVWCGGCVSCPPPLSRLCGSPPPLAGVCWWCVPLLSPLRALFLLSLFRVAWGGVSLVSCLGLPGCGGWGGVLVAGSGPFPWCFPVGGPMLALPVRV